VSLVMGISFNVFDHYHNNTLQGQINHQARQTPLLRHDVFELPCKM
jgi:hypothetical protein